ncbi:MAG: Delta-60 repeat-containing protein [Myxococcaceae bacterium]|nr:Delta-60 repeat-containing protein [Myxococcaceae bacterium]
MRTRLGLLGSAFVLVLVSVLASCGGDDSNDNVPVDDAGADGSSTDGASTTDGTTSDGATTDGATSDASTDAGPAPDVAAFALDPTFGEAGVATANVRAPGPTRAAAGALQADGKIVVVGSTGEALFVARYEATGTLDPSFATGGIFQLPIGGFTSANAVAIESDQKIVIAGGFSGASTGSAFVLRLSTSGTLDTAFGNQGLATSPGAAYAVAIQADGAVVSAGYDEMSRRYVRRHLASGAVDTSFGAGGVATHPTSGSWGSTLTVQSDGKILVGGHLGSSLLVERLTTAGALDTTFATGGSFVSAGGGGSSQADSIVVQSDGKLVVGGYYQPTGSTAQLAVGRLGADGTVDTTFGAGSTGWITFGGSSGAAESLVLLADGSILAGGWSGSISGIVHFTAAGAVDTTFGSNGFASADFGGATMETVLRLADGTLFGVGTLPGNSDTRVELSHFSATGAHDTTFGTNGLLKVQIGGTFDRALAVALQPDGKILETGLTSLPFYGTVALARFGSNGVLDTTFKNGATVSANVSTAHDLALQSTGKIVVAGPAFNENPGPVGVLRFDGAGTLDTTFGTSGTAVAGVNNQAAYFGDVAVAPDDSIVGVSGTLAGLFGVLRYTSNGALDTTFGTSGYVTTSFGVGVTARAHVVTLASDGKIIVVGLAAKKLALARYSALGQLDAAFGTAGTTTIDLGVDVTPFHAVLQPDGKLVIAARRGARGQAVDVLVVRLTPSGALDATFGTAGVATQAAGVLQETRGQTPSPVGLALLPDGRAIVTSSFSSDGLSEDLLVMRLDTLGSLDARSVLALGPGIDAGHAVAIQPDGRILVAGETWRPSTGADMALVRLIAP